MNEEYQEIDLIDLAKKILKFWWLLLIFMVIAAGSAYYVTKTYITPLYKANASIFIGKESGDLGFSLSESFYVGSELVTDYTELVKTNLVLDQVIKELKLESSTDTLRGKIGVEVINESRFIYITVLDPSPEMAVAIADKVAVVLKEKAVEIVGVKNVNIVDYAVLPKEKDSPSTKKNVAIAAILGLMFGLFLIFINMMMNNTIEKEEDVETAIGIAVIGVIPKFKGEVRK